MPFTDDAWVHDPDRPWENEEDEPCWNDYAARELLSYLRMTREERREVERKRDRGGK